MTADEADFSLAPHGHRVPSAPDSIRHRSPGSGQAGPAPGGSATKAVASKGLWPLPLGVPFCRACRPTDDAAACNTVNPQPVPCPLSRIDQYDMAVQTIDPTPLRCDAAKPGSGDKARTVKRYRRP